MSLQSLTTYCTQTDVEALLSADGVRLRLDDDGGGVVSTAEQVRMTDSIASATETVNYYCDGKYTSAMLATSNWVARNCAVLAAYELCLCRGNDVPDSLVERAGRVEDWLKEIRDGAGKVPGLALRRALAPTFDNVNVDPRFTYRVIRVERRNSSRRPNAMPVQTDYREAYSYEI